MSTPAKTPVIDNEIFREYLADCDNLPYGTAIVKNDAECTVIEANPAYYRIIGHTKEQLLENHGNRIAEILIDNVYSAVQVKKTTEDYDIEFDLRLRTSDGKIRWVHDFAHYKADKNIFFITVTDITDKMVTPAINLSFEAFHVRNQILAYVSKYTSECVVVNDVETDEVVYMNPSAMRMLNFQNESDWIGKTYVNIIFGSPENIPVDYAENLEKESYVVEEFYNKFYKKYARTEVKVINIPTLKRKFRVQIISDITPQKRLEHKIALHKTLNECMDSLFISTTTDTVPDAAYYKILNKLKSYYQADLAFFHKFKDENHEIEDLYEVYADGIPKMQHSLPIIVPDCQMKLLETLSNTKTANYLSILESMSKDDADELIKMHNTYNLNSISCVVVKNKADETIALMGVTNPHTHEDDKELLNLLSRFICMFIEHQEDQEVKEEALTLEASSKANIIEKCTRNFQSLNHAKDKINDSLDALCKHYDADFAVILSRDADTNSYGISYVGGQKIPDMTKFVNQPSDAVDKWHYIFEKHSQFVTDNDLDEPVVLSILKKEFGIHNFIASPLMDETGDLIGLLFVNNYKFMNRAHFMVHVVAKNISDYMDRIMMYQQSQLNSAAKLDNRITTQSQISTLLEVGASGTLFIIDIDNFKQLNDTLGHHIGDQVLVDFAVVLKRIFHTTDIVGRIGGDDFMVFTPGLVADNMIVSKANQILSLCKHRYEKDGIEVEISASVGICLANGGRKTFQPLYENADYALFIAKKSGKNQFHIYSDDEYRKDASATDDLRFYHNVVNTLKTAIANHGFVVHYQPIHHLPTAKYTQAEALVRIVKPDGSLIYPNDFIQVAENTGLIVEITYQVLEQVCCDFRKILNKKPDNCLNSISINVPYLQFTEPNMEERFLEILEKYDIKPNQIKLEITERAIISDIDLLTRKMASMTEKGFIFELDDFGTDYSNLQTSLTLPLNVFKIDRSLLLAASKTEKGRNFFGHIISGLHETGSHTVIEGVETKEQLDWATECNCEFIQGFYFSKPVDFENFYNLLESENVNIVAENSDVALGNNHFNATTSVVPNLDKLFDDKLLKKIGEKSKSYVLDFLHFPCGIAVVLNDNCATLYKANPAFYEIIGHTKDGFEKDHGNRMSDIFVDDFLNTVKDIPTETNYTKEWDIRIRTADGHIHWVHDVAHYDAELNVFFIVYVDITDKMDSTGTGLSYEAFKTKNEVLLYLNKYTARHYIVSDLLTDEIVYMSSSAMHASGLEKESDWCGKTHIEIAFGSEENVHPSYHKPLKEDEFTVYEYFNTYHKKYVQTKNKIINIPTLHRKLRFTITKDITAQKQLERKIAAQHTLQNCIEALFTVGNTNTESEKAYYEILNELKKHYKADRAFFYKFKSGTYNVENIFHVSEPNLEKFEFTLPMTATNQQIEKMQEVAKLNLVYSEKVVNSFNGNYKEHLEKAYKKYGIESFACVAINDNHGKLVAFMGITNPKDNGHSKSLMELLSRFICMFVEHEQDHKTKENALILEATSKKNLLAQSSKSFLNVENPNQNINNVLNALRNHYMADFAIIVSRNQEGAFGVSYKSSGVLPDLSGLHQSRKYMGNWLEMFQNHRYYASDLDFDDENSPIIKKLLHDKFGVKNFVASPMRNSDGELTGLLIVNNLRLTERAHLIVHIISKDISDYLEKIKLQETMQLEPTTQLVNKVATQNQISELLENGVKGTLFILDIDNFKNVNDTLGHRVGDKAIIEVAEKLKSISRSTDIVGRVGGDEFMIFCPGLIAENSIKIKAQDLLENCRLNFKKHGHSAEISMSIGACRVGDNASSFDDLYDKADHALYTSKDCGKNRFALFNPEK